MRIAFTNAIEQRECADEKVVARWGQPGPESEQAASRIPGRRGTCDHIGQPAFERRDARTRDPRPMACKSPLRRIDRGAACEGLAGVDQPCGRWANGPGRRSPRFSLI